MSVHVQPSAGRGVLVTAALGSMLAPLNSTMIVVALPAMLSEFDRSLAWGSWIVISYLVAMAAVQPLGGSLGDRYGRRRLFLIGLVGFLLASVGAGFAPNIDVLIVARTVQAITGAMAIPNGTALVRSLVPSERQGMAFGRIGAGIAIAAGVGPPLGGIVTDALGWRWIFAVNVLLVVPALLLGLRLPAGRSVTRFGRFDFYGASLMTTGLVTLALSLTVWRLDGAPPVLAALFGVVAITAVVGLRRHVRDHDRPVLNLRLFARPGYTPATLAVMLSNMTMYTVLLSLPVFLTERAGWTSREVGILLAGLSLQMAIFAPAGGWLSDRRGRRFPATLGMLLLTAGAMPFIALSTDWLWPLYLAPLVVIGIGLGLSSASIQTAAIEVVPVSETGQAAGLFSTMRYLGSITGSAVMAAILSGPEPAVSNFRILYGLLVLAACGALLAATKLPGAIRHLQPLSLRRGTAR